MLVFAATWAFDRGGALGATKQWGGSSSEFWNVSANWTPSGVPTAADTVIVSPASAIPCIIVAPGMTSGPLAVGQVGVFGDLRIHDGSLSTSGGSSIGVQAGSLGRVEVAGPATWAVGAFAAPLTVGESGAGVLRVVDGGEINGGYSVQVGYWSGSQGEILVEGAGSYFESNLDFFVGFRGYGAMTVAEGGHAITGTTIHVGYENGSLGTLTVESGGTVECEDLVAATQSGSDGTVNISGAGATVAASGTTYIGSRDHGQLIITNGGVLNSQLAVAGNWGGSTASIFVDGPGSHWLTSGSFHLGDAGAAGLIISNGGAVECGNLWSAFQSGSVGTVSISGAGSSLTVTTGIGLNIGTAGHGELNITNGGVATCASASAGATAGSTASVLVSGPGSQWDVSGNLAIGSSGQADMTISNGGYVNSGTTWTGTQATSIASASITGPGSAWVSTGTRYIGYGGAGELTLVDGGLASSPAIILGNQAGGMGVLNLGAPAGSPAELPGTVDAPSITTGNGEGTIHFNHTGEYSTWDNANASYQITGSTKIVKRGPGTTILRRTNNTYTGGTTVYEGVLRAVANGSLGANSSTVTLKTGGVLMNQEADLNLSSARTIVLAEGEGRLCVGWNKTLTVNGPVQGPGDLVVIGDDGVVILAGEPKTHTGATNVSGGALFINSSVASAANRALAGGTLGGDGVINGSLSVRADGVLSPGPAPDAVGSLHVTVQSEFRGGSIYHWNLKDAALDAVSGAGIGWDVLTLGSPLNFTSTPGVTVVVTTIDPNTGLPGAADGFDPNQPYSWLIIDGSASGAGNQYPNFNATAFTIDTSEFANAHSGTFSVRRDDRLIFLDYTPAPTAPGDMNCDGVVDLADVDPFIMALLDPDEFVDAYPACDIAHGDMNQDLAVDGLDVQDFLAAVLGS